MLIVRKVSGKLCSGAGVTKPKANPGGQVKREFLFHFCNVLVWLSVFIKTESLDNAIREFSLA